MIIETNIEFGKEYTDKNSKFKGRAVCISKWQYGCIRVSLQPKIDMDGKMPESEWFDEESLEGVIPIISEPGGPRPNPKRNKDIG